MAKDDRNFLSNVFMEAFIILKITYVISTMSFFSFRVYILVSEKYRRRKPDIMEMFDQKRIKRKRNMKGK